MFYEYDRSGVALEASNTFLKVKKRTNIVSLTDAVNKLFKYTHKHTIWKTESLGSIEVQIHSEEMTWTVIWALIFAKELHNIEIPTTYLNSNIEKEHQIVRKMSEKLGLGLKEVA